MASFNFLALPQELRYITYAFAFNHAMLSIVDAGLACGAGPNRVKAPPANLPHCQRGSRDLPRPRLPCQSFRPNPRAYNLQNLIPARTRSRIEAVTGHRHVHDSAQQLGRAVLPNLKKVHLAVDYLFRAVMDDDFERYFSADAVTVRGVTSFMMRYIDCKNWSKQRAVPLLAAGVEVVLTARVSIQECQEMPGGFGDRQLVDRYYDVEVLLALNGTQVVKTMGRIVENILLEQVDHFSVEWEAV